MNGISFNTLKTLSKIDENKNDLIDKIKNNILQLKEEIIEKQLYIKKYIESYKLLEDYQNILLSSIENNNISAFTIDENNNKTYIYNLAIPFNAEINNSLIFAILFEKITDIYNKLNYSNLINNINSKLNLSNKNVSFIYDPNKKDIFLLVTLEMINGEIHDIIDKFCEDIKNEL